MRFGENRTHRRLRRLMQSGKANHEVETPGFERRAFGILLGEVDSRTHRLCAAVRVAKQGGAHVDAVSFCIRPGFVHGHGRCACSASHVEDASGGKVRISRSCKADRGATDAVGAWTKKTLRVEECATIVECASRDVSFAEVGTVAARHRVIVVVLDVARHRELIVQRQRPLAVPGPQTRRLIDQFR